MSTTLCEVITDLTHVLLGTFLCATRRYASSRGERTASGVTVGLTVSTGGQVAPVLGTLADHTTLHTALVVPLFLPVVALALSTRLDERNGGRA